MEQQLADTANYEEGSTQDGDHFEARYEKYRDDQMNTGVIAALLGGFALTNSWEMEVSGECTPTELASYCLAIVSVHACTCSALMSAFLYRTLTSKPTCKKGCDWIDRHRVLAQSPWWKFMFGTLCYVVSVCLVAWSTLEFNTIARVIILVVGLMSCSMVLYTLYKILTDKDPEDEEEEAIARRPKRDPSALKK